MKQIYTHNIHFFQQQQVNYISNLDDKANDINHLETNEITKKESILEKYFPFLFKDKRIRHNFYIWTFGMISDTVSNVGCYYLLNSLKGNLYFNCLFTTFFEMVAGFMATYLVIYFHNQLKQVIKITSLITGILFVACIFIQNPEQKIKSNDIFNVHSLLIFLQQVSPVILAKVSFEITWTALLSYQKYVIPTDYQQSQFSFSNLITMFFLSCVPYYKYISTKLKFNPFIGFGILFLLSSYFSTKFEVIQESEETQENEQTKNNEENINQEVKSQYP